MIKLILESERENEQQLIADLKQVIKAIKNNCWGEYGAGNLKWEIRDEDSDMRDELFSVSFNMIFSVKDSHVKFMGNFDEDEIGWFFNIYTGVELPYSDFLDKNKREAYLPEAILKAKVDKHRFASVKDAYECLKRGFNLKMDIIEPQDGYYAISSMDLNHLSEV